MDHCSTRIFAGLLFFLTASCGGYRPQLQPPDDSLQQPKISGGSYANEGQLPFVAIVHRLMDSGQVAHCGGTVISKRWVLTAGHCLAGSPSRFFVIFGTINNNRIGYDTSHGPGVSMITSTAFVHPELVLNKNDIGLLYMPRDIPFTDKIQPIRLAGPKDSSILVDMTLAYVAGWGSDGVNLHTILLKYTPIPLISKSRCHLYWQVDFRNICTKPRLTSDACQGDSGGPLFIMKDNQPLQIGIVSYGDSHCPSNRPGVYTKVAAFVEWIQDVTGLEF